MTTDGDANTGFSSRLRERRGAAGFTRNAMADRCRISRTYLWQLETRPGKAPSADILARLADALGTTMDHLWRGTPCGPAESFRRIAASFEAIRAELATPGARGEIEFPPPADSESIESLGLGSRASHACRRLGIATVEQLTRRSAGEIGVRGYCGVASIRQVRERLAARGLRLRGDSDDQFRTAQGIR